MTTMTCPPAEQLKAFYLGQLPDDPSDELVAHVGACPACQAELETVVDAEDSLIANLREPDTSSNLNHEAACELGMLRALGALATAYEPTADEDFDDSENESLPKTIGEYEIVRALGQGGMGHVYLARHSKLGRLVALKILAGHRLGDRRASQRFEAEMRAVGRLSHPNIVTAHDAREIDGTAVLVTEFIDGFDLGQLLQRTGSLAVPDACEIIRQVALALQYTSDQGFVHRDVKPSNVMLSASGEVKLLDLGLARLQYGDVESADVTGTGQTMGTADYISPEQVTDSRKVDVRSDIYSLGVTLFKLLVGRAPFADSKYNTAFAKMTAHVSTTPATVRSLRNDVPEELSRLVASMLAKRPDDRPQKPDAIATKLSAFTNGSNLELLVRTAGLVDVTQTSSKTVTASVEPKTATQSVWYRPVKLYVAIAAGLVGILLGFCFGIIITITNPDGSKTVMKLPAGSRVEVSEEENKQSKPSKPDTQTIGSRTTSFLEFGAVEHKDLGNGPYIRMVPVAANVEVSNPKLSNTDTKTNQLYVSIDGNHVIPADRIWGHVLDVKLLKKGDSSSLELTFDDSLTHLMLSLTREHIGHQLAILVEGKIVAAPRINAPITSKAVIEGTFTPEQLEGLERWLRAAKSVAPSDVGETPKTPAPTFDGHTLDEWLTLLQTEKSRNGQIAAIQGLRGLRTEQNSQRILDVALALIDSTQTQTQTPEVYELVRTLLGPDALGSWLIEQLNKNDIRLTKRLLILNTEGARKSPQLRPEQYLIAEWLADPKHQLIAEPDTQDIRELTCQDCIRFFLYDMFYAPDLKEDAIEALVRVAKNQPAIGDADTFLLGVPCIKSPNEGRLPEDGRLKVFADLALSKLLDDKADVLQATRAMSILVVYPQLIPREKIPALTAVTQKRFEALLQSRERIDALVDQAASHFVISSIQSPASMLIWHPSESRCSETLSLLYFTHFLGAPAELEGMVAKLREITQPEHERAVGVWKKGTGTSEDYLVWPFDPANNQKHNPKIISEIGAGAWRAAYYDLIANLVQRSFASRKKAADELAGSEAAALLNEAMRDFARVVNYGDGEDIQKRGFVIPKHASDSRAELLKSIVSNFKTIDANSDSMLSVAEYARYLANRAKQNVSKGTPANQPPLPPQSPNDKRPVTGLIKDALYRDYVGSPQPRRLALMPLVSEQQKLREQYVQGVIDLLKAIDQYIQPPRKTVFDDHDIRRLADRFFFLTSNSLARFPIPSHRIPDAVRAACPLNGIVEISEGVDKESAWLLSVNESVFRVMIKPDVLYNDIKNFVDASYADLEEKNAFEQFVALIQSRRKSPVVDLKKDVVDHLRGNVFFVLSSQGDLMVALESDNPSAMLLAARRFAGDEQTIRVVGEYLLIGPKQQVEEAAIKFAARSPHKTSELVRIGIAFQDFNQAHKRLPAAKSRYLPNKPKKLPPYSWRVAILPYIGCDSLYREYDFNEPWDSEKNLKLLDKMPTSYRSPRAPTDQKPGVTNFLAFVGESTAMANDAGVFLSDIGDGSSTTVLLVETKRSVPWTKPEDLPFNGLQDAKLAEPFEGLDLNCLMVDGTVLSLKQPIDWERLGNMVTASSHLP